MHQSIPEEVVDDREYNLLVSRLVTYLFQGIHVLCMFWESMIYFGDYKPENYLVDFKGTKMILGDFGIAM